MRRLAAAHPFALWLSAATCSTLGGAVTFFALGWSASGHGPGAVGLVITVEGVPLCLLILVGGVVADRWGVRRTMVACDAAMVLVMVAFAVVARHGAPVPVLAALAFLSGIARGLRRPAETVFPRLFATGEELSRRMATATLFLQLARIAGPGVAGTLLAVGGLSLTSTLDAVSFAAVLLVLLAVRPPQEPPRRDVTTGSVLGGLVEGVRVARRTPVARAAVLAVVLLASTVLPLVSLCVPLVARERGWSAHDAGLVTAAWVVGGLAVTAAVARRGSPSVAAALAGPAVAAGGAGLLVATRGVVPAFLALVLVGLGTSLLTTRLFPTFLAATPPDMLARFSSLLGIAQTGPVLLVTPVLAWSAEAAGTGPAVLALGALLLVTTVPAVLLERAAAAQDLSAVEPTGAEVA